MSGTKKRGEEFILVLSFCNGEACSCMCVRGACACQPSIFCDCLYAEYSKSSVTVVTVSVCGMTCVGGYGGSDDQHAYKIVTQSLYVDHGNARGKVCACWGGGGGVRWSKVPLSPGLPLALVRKWCGPRACGPRACDINRFVDTCSELSPNIWFICNIYIFLHEHCLHEIP